jgi:sugar phosphate isomerase/epimerase
MKDTARAAAQLGVQVVTGFTGSSVWHMLYSFPPNDWAEVERGYQDFAERWGPIIDVFDARACASPSRSIPRRSPTTS